MGPKALAATGMSDVKRPKEATTRATRTFITMVTMFDLADARI